MNDKPSAPSAYQQKIIDEILANQGKPKVGRGKRPSRRFQQKMNDTPMHSDDTKTVPESEPSYDQVILIRI